LAIELGLKGFLREKGMSETKQRALNHDLVKAFETAVRCGFKPTHKLQERLVRDLDPHYKDMSLRYSAGTSVELLRLPQAIPVTRLLLYDLHTQRRSRNPSDVPPN